jgi:hypothetical protein
VSPGGDRSSLLSVAGINLVAWLSSPGGPAPQGCFRDVTTASAHGKSIANRFLDENESLSYGGPKGRGWPTSGEVYPGAFQ